MKEAGSSLVAKLKSNRSYMLLNQTIRGEQVWVRLGIYLTTERYQSKTDS